MKGQRERLQGRRRERDEEGRERGYREGGGREMKGQRERLQDNHYTKSQTTCSAHLNFVYA